MPIPPTWRALLYENSYSLVPSLAAPKCFSANRIVEPNGSHTAVLFEVGFLTNPEDEKQLVSPAWRATMAKTLSRSVDRYFGDRLAEGPN